MPESWVPGDSVAKAPITVSWVIVQLTLTWVWRPMAMSVVTHAARADDHPRSQLHVGEVDLDAPDG